MLKEKTGEVAGAVWHVLHQSQGLNFEQVREAIHEETNYVLLALGWLLREDKIACDDGLFNIK